MAPKGKAADKDKGGAAKGGAAKGAKGKGKTEEKEEKAGKVKASQFINVRHILVHISDRRREQF
jgi:NIMA-interacting peptidyl-prolyl cis-trans isomerase 4